MEKLMLAELLEATGGVPAGDRAEEVPSAEILSVVTDSRKITPGCVFFALSGDRFDGHAYVEAALENGAAGCVISREPSSYLPGKFYVLVPDTRRALGDLAHYYRKKYDVKVVGITGSVGKTTCRGMVTSVLSRRFRVHATEGNFNNEIGLPLTVFGLSAQDEVLVLEMGMNHAGEIRRLSQIAAPDIAVITNIGTAHIGYLGSRENIFRAKMEIFDGMEPGSSAVLCGDDDYLPQAAKDPALADRYRIVYAGKGELCGFRVRDVHVEVSGLAGRAGSPEGCTRPEKESRDMSANDAPAPENDTSAPENDAPAPEIFTSCTIEMPGYELPVRIPAAGMHLIYPASIAAAVGHLLGMTGEEIRAGIGDFQGQRMQCEKIGGILLFDDTYNASPDSMRSSLQVLACMPVVRRAAVLGDMLEQGEYAPQLHREVGAAAAEAGLDTLLTVGPLSADMAQEAMRRGVPDVRAFPDSDSAAEAVEEITQPGTAILFKASHVMALDRLACVSRRRAQALEEAGRHA